MRIVPISIGTPEATAFVGKIASIYSPELSVGFSSVGRLNLKLSQAHGYGVLMHALGLL